MLIPRFETAPPIQSATNSRFLRSGGCTLRRYPAASDGSLARVKDDLRFAHALADAADAVTTARFRASDPRGDTKPGLTPVSEADRRAEEVIRERVASSGRGEGVLGEEFGDDGGDAKWIVDPIDGTTNFVRGVPVWATLLALQRDGVVDVALISAPALGRRWWALRGAGAFAAGDHCRVSHVGRVEDAAVSTTSARRMPEGWRTIVQRAWSNRGLGDFWQHCLVAEGALEIACDPVMEVWDYVSVRLLVEEAGGRCTTFDGAEPAAKRSFVTTNGLLHDEAVALLGTA